MSEQQINDDKQSAEKAKEPIKYLSLRVPIPEGGEIAVFWPEHMTAPSCDMMVEMVIAQMDAHKKWAAIAFEKSR